MANSFFALLVRGGGHQQRGSGGGAPEASRRRKRRDACGAGVGRARANARPGDCRSARGRVAACDPITAGGAVPWRPGLVVSPAPGCTGRMPPRVGHARVCPRDDACRQLPLSCRHPRVLLCVSQPVASLCTAAPPPPPAALIPSLVTTRRWHASLGTRKRREAQLRRTQGQISPLPGTPSACRLCAARCHPISVRVHTADARHVTNQRPCRCV